MKGTVLRGYCSCCRTQKELSHRGNEGLDEIVAKLANVKSVTPNISFAGIALLTPQLQVRSSSNATWSKPNSEVKLKGHGNRAESDVKKKSCLWGCKGKNVQPLCQTRLLVSKLYDADLYQLAGIEAIASKEGPRVPFTPGEALSCTWEVPEQEAFQVLAHQSGYAFLWLVLQELQHVVQLISCIRPGFPVTPHNTWVRQNDSWGRMACLALEKEPSDQAEDSSLLQDVKMGGLSLLRLPTSHPIQVSFAPCRITLQHVLDDTQSFLKNCDDESD